MIKFISFRLDSGTNMCVSNCLKYFSQLFRRRIGVKLGAEVNSHSKGVGIVLVSAPEYPSKLIALYSTFFVPRDSTCTISNDTLKKCAGFKKVMMGTGNQVHLTHHNGSQMSLPLSTCDSINYISFNIYAPTRETI